MSRAATAPPLHPQQQHVCLPVLLRCLQRGRGFAVPVAPCRKDEDMLMAEPTALYDPNAAEDPGARVGGLPSAGSAVVAGGCADNRWHVAHLHLHAPVCTCARKCVCAHARAQHHSCSSVCAAPGAANYHAYLLLSCEGRRTMVLETGEELNEVTQRWAWRVCVGGVHVRVRQRVGGQRGSCLVACARACGRAWWPLWPPAHAGAPNYGH